MTTWSEQSKNTATFTDASKSDPDMSEQTLLIDDTYGLFIDGTYQLLIQSAVSSTSWSNQTKS